MLDSIRPEYQTLQMEDGHESMTASPTFSTSLRAWLSVVGREVKCRSPNSAIAANNRQNPAADTFRDKNEGGSSNVSTAHKSFDAEITFPWGIKP